MGDYTADELHAARPPIASLISKSEKAQAKLAAGTGQHAMLEDNLKALRIASALMNEGATRAEDLARSDLELALPALGSMVARTQDAQAKFSSGTSQHTLLTNRLNALRVAEFLVEAELKRC